MLHFHLPAQRGASYRGVDPLRAPFCGNRARVERIESPALDAMIRQARWRFMELGSCSRTGCGLTEERQLNELWPVRSRRFNAAEFESLQIAR